jgi:hypothetical protein
MLSSRAVRRIAKPIQSHIEGVKSEFSKLTSNRRNLRPTSMSETLLERLRGNSQSSSSGLDVSLDATAREEEFKQALECALGSLGKLGPIFREREIRWHSEMASVKEETENYQMRQAFGGIMPVPTHPYAHQMQHHLHAHPQMQMQQLIHGQVPLTSYRNQPVYVI